MKSSTPHVLASALHIAVVTMLFATAMPAGVVTYTLNNRRFFPAADGTVADTTSNPFTATTNDSKTTTHTDTLTGNQYSGFTSIATGPFEMTGITSITLAQATTSSVPGIMSLVSVGINETGVTVTGGSGTGFLLPTFHVHGFMDDNNASLQLGIATCAGSNGCILSGPASTATPGFHPVDALFTPTIGSTTAFTFGNPFTFFFFMEPSISYFGSQADPGGTSTSSFQMELVSVQVVDAEGRPIPGAQIHSTFLDIAAPEPGGVLLCGLGLAGIALRRRRGARARVDIECLDCQYAADRGNTARTLRDPFAAWRRRHGRGLPGA